MTAHLTPGELQEMAIEFHARGGTQGYLERTKHWRALTHRLGGEGRHIQRTMDRLVHATGQEMREDSGYICIETRDADGEWEDTGRQRPPAPTPPPKQPTLFDMIGWLY